MTGKVGLQATTGKVRKQTTTGKVGGQMKSVVVHGTNSGMDVDNDKNTEQGYGGSVEGPIILLKR